MGFARRCSQIVYSLIGFTSLAYVGTASAAVSVPQALSLGGQLFNSDGSVVARSGVNFRVQIMDSSQTCVLFQEDHAGQDLSASGGHFNLILGTGTSIVNNVGTAGALDAKVFLNAGPTAVAGCASSPLNLSAGGQRQIVVLYDLGAGLTPMSPSIPVVSTANAMIADSLGGFTATDFIHANGTSALSQANEEYAFSLTNWPRLKALLDGTSAQYLSSAPTAPLDFNGQRITDLHDPTAAQDAATKHYVDTNLGGSSLNLGAVGPMTGGGSTLIWDQTANQWVAGTPNTSPTGAAGGSLSGTYPNPTLASDVIKSTQISSSGIAINRLIITDGTTGTNLGYGECMTAGQVYAWTASGWQCTGVSALSPVTSVAGKTGAVTLNAADVSGLGTAALFNWGTSANQIVRLDGSARLPAVDGSQILNVNAVQLQGRGVASTAPTAGQVLGWNGAAWTPVAAAGGSVTSVSGGAGLLGGTITASGTLSVDVGTAANQIMQLNASAQAPAVDGSLLTQVNAAKLQGRTLASTPPGANQVLGWNAAASQWEPATAALGSVTSIATANGILGGPITTSGTLSLNTGTAANQIVQLSASAQLPSVDGSQLTQVNAVTLQTRAVAATAPTAGQVLGWNAVSTRWEPTTGAAGSVTSFATGTGLLGGPITTTGTISVDVGYAANKIVQENATAQIAQGAGSAGAPAYTFNGNTNTGVYSPGANQVALSANGTAALTVLASGYVGLGTTAPAYSLDVRSSAATSSAMLAPATWGAGGVSTVYLGDTNSYVQNSYGGNFTIRGNANMVIDPSVNNFQVGSTARLMVTGANGYVGINTNAPQAGLDIATVGTGGSGVILPRDTTTNRPSGVNGMLRYNTSLNAFEGFANNVWSTIAAGSAAGTVTNIAAGTGLLGGPITTTGTLSVNVGTAANQIVQQNANAQIAQSAGTSSLPSYTFAGNTATGLYSPGVNQLALATNGSAALSVLANGNVGIGTSAPNATLQVAYTTGQANGPFSVSGSGGNTVSVSNYGVMRVDDLYLGSDSNVGSGRAVSDLGKLNVTSGVNGTASFDIVLKASGSGKVGVGTDTPQAALDVNASGSAPSAILIPRDTTLNRPSGVNGMIRYNTTANALEGFVAGAWSTIAAGSAAGTITNIASGTGLLGGPITTTGTLSVNVGTAPSQILQLNSNAQVAPILGSATLPAYSFAAGTNTGLFSPSAGSLALSANGTAAVTVAASGFVGIGTTTPTSALSLGLSSGSDITGDYGASFSALKLRYITGERLSLVSDGNQFPSQANGNYGAIKISNGASSAAYIGGANNNGLVFNPVAGNVGIGTLVPQAALDVYSLGTAASAIIIPRDTTTNRPTNGINGMLRYNTTNNAFEGFANNTWSTIAAGTAAGTVTNIASGTGLLGGPITTSGTLSVNVGTGANQIVQLNGSAQAAVQAGSAAAPAYSFAGNVATGLFSPGAGAVALSANGTAALSVASSGYVGINTSAPSTFLEISTTSGSVSSSQVITNMSPAAGSGSRLSFRSASVPASYMEQGLTDGTYNSYLAFGTRGNNAIAERLRIDPLGNLGLGTTAPQAGLDVALTGSIASAIIVPRDSSANRPSGVNGMIRYNTTNNAFEGFANNAWSSLGAGAGTSAGTVTNVAAGTGLLGGPITSSGTLSVNVGTAPNQIVQFNSGAQIAPAFGTAALPAYAFAGNVNTGLYSPAAGSLALSANGTAAFTVAASGSIGIGTATPAGILDISSSATNYAAGAPSALRFSNSAASGQNLIDFYTSGTARSRIRADNNGNLSFVAYGGGHSFYVNGDYATGKSTLGLNSDGSVGIGGSIIPGQVTGAAISVVPNGNVGFGTGAPQAGLDVALTGTIASAIIVPRDTTANRPTNGVNGMLRYNTTNAAFEGFANNAWSALGAGSGTSAGTVTNVVAGTGLLGGPITTSGTLSVNVGTAPNQIVQENSAAQIAQPSGTAGGPSYTFAGQLSSGMYNPGTNQVSIATAGSPRLTVAANGYVGVGTLTPLAAFDVTATGTTSAMIVPRDTTANRPGGVNGMLRYNTSNNAFEGYQNGNWTNVISAGATPGGSTSAVQFNSGGSFAGDQTTFAWDNTNKRLGIGTATPAAKLDVAGGQVVSRDNAVASGATVNFASGNTQVLSSVGGTTLTLSNMIGGASYTIVIADATSRTYSLNGCVNSYWSAPSSATTGRTLFSIQAVTNGSGVDCYVSWATGYQ